MKRRLIRGYTLAEVLVASAIISLAMGGAVRLIATMQIQEEAAREGSVAYNLQENAGRLWQLGLSPATVAKLIPVTTTTAGAVINDDLASSVGSYTDSTGDGFLDTISFGTVSTYTAANNMGNLENISLTITIQNPVGGATRTNIVQLYRPTIR